MFRSSHILIALAFVLAACGGSATPQLIGSYPQGTDAGAPAESWSSPAANVLVVYNAHLELEVSDTDWAADRAKQYAYDHGGYLVSSQSWYRDGRRHYTLTLAVPVARFESLRGDLLSLGTLLNESVSGDLEPVGEGESGWNTYSHITVQLRPAAASISLPPVSTGGWNPARTFGQAFGVFASIFTFLVDAVIWVTVVIGPFVLMGLGIRSLIKRWRKGP